MIAKVCTYGANREQAIRRMRRAINETRVLGIETNLSLHLAILDDPRFQKGHYDTGLLANLQVPSRPNASDLEYVAAALVEDMRSTGSQTNAPAQKEDASLWLAIGRQQQLGGAR